MKKNIIDKLKVVEFIDKNGEITQISGQIFTDNIEYDEVQDKIAQVVKDIGEKKILDQEDDILLKNAIVELYIITNNIPALDELLISGFDLETYENYLGMKAPQIAAKDNNRKMLQYLFLQGIDLNATNSKTGQTTFEYLMDNADDDTTRYYLRNGGRRDRNDWSKTVEMVEGLTQDNKKKIQYHDDMMNLVKDSLELIDLGTSRIDFFELFFAQCEGGINNDTVVTVKQGFIDLQDAVNDFLGDLREIKNVKEYIISLQEAYRNYGIIESSMLTQIKNMAEQGIRILLKNEEFCKLYVDCLNIGVFTPQVKRKLINLENKTLKMAEKHIFQKVAA